MSLERHEIECSVSRHHLEVSIRLEEHREQCLDFGDVSAYTSDGVNAILMEKVFLCEEIVSLCQALSE